MNCGTMKRAVLEDADHPAICVFLQRGILQVAPFDRRSVNSPTRLDTSKEHVQYFNLYQKNKRLHRLFCL